MYVRGCVGVYACVWVCVCVSVSVYACVHVQKADGSNVINIDEDSQRFHFAVTGKSWGIIRQYQPDLLSKVCTAFLSSLPNLPCRWVIDLLLLFVYAYHTFLCLLLLCTVHCILGNEYFACRERVSAAEYIAYYSVISTLFYCSK